MLDEGGVVIGVVNARIEDADNVGFAIRAEALIRLAKEKLVEMIPRRGVRISQIDLGKHIALLETRKALDVLIATRAARRVNQQQKDTLREYASGMLAAADSGDIDTYIEIDTALDLLLEPALPENFGIEDFQRAEEAEEQGYVEASAKLPAFLAGLG